MAKETFIVQTDQNNEINIIGSSTKGAELGQILIDAFTPLNSHERNTTSNNAFMVGLQVKLELGVEKYNYMRENFGEMDWKMAWVLFNDHFNNENPLNY